MIINRLRQFVFLFLIMVIAAGCNHHETKKAHPKSILPSLYITVQPDQLDSILLDREHKANADVLLLSDELDTIYCGELEYIKSRGNTTFNTEKKSFTIKFPQKIRLLGLNKSRSFVLLANAYDESYIRNAVSLDLARAMGIPASRYAYLSLYINEEYRGLYQITNKVDVGKNALNIKNLNKLNEQVNPLPLNEYTWFAYGRKGQVLQRKGVLLERNPENISGGYLLDNSGVNVLYCKSVSGFVSNAGDPIQIRCPKYASPEEVEYIAEVYNSMEAAVLSNDGYHPRTGKHYSEYMDIESFARYYLLNEIVLNYDGGWASFMMYKDTDSINSKIYAGPAWDFDRALDNPRFRKEIMSYCQIYVNNEKGNPGQRHSGGLLYHLMQHDDFKKLVKCIYNQEIKSICHNYLENKSWDSIAEYLNFEAEKDYQLYKARYSSDYDMAVSIVADFLRKRIEFFDWFYSTDENNMIRVALYEMNNSKFYAYLPLDIPVYYPKAETHNNNDPVYLYYYEGTDSLVKEGTVFHEAQHFELRRHEPSWCKIQTRRIQKKLKKLF